MAIYINPTYISIEQSLLDRCITNIQIVKMKLFVVCFLGVVALSTAVPTSPPKPQPSSRGCRYILGRCAEECPEGTQAYSTGCSPRTPEATCDEPNPVAEAHPMCDYSACYCSAPTVRDTNSGKCVKLEDCPKKA